MTTYYCKCGRIVRKSTGADNTGNRMEGYAPGHECFGCPYVMPWGENRYEEGKGFHLEVKGYECRMSQSLEYASRFSGSVADKCTCSIVSLDFDFLDRVSGWIAGTYPGGELAGKFERSQIRAVEYVSNGRYRMTVTCAQNKAGMAAKAALLEQFFNPDGSRRDLTPEQEKEKILNDIKAATQEKEATPCAASPNPQSPTPAAAPSQSPGPGTAHGACTGTIAPGGRMYSAVTGMIYAVRRQPDGVYRIMCCYAGEEWERTTIPVLSAPCSCAESLQELLDAFAKSRSWEAYESADPCKECRCKTCGDNSCLQAHCDGSDHGMGCIREDGCYVPAEAEPPAEPAPANTTAEPAADGNEPKENALAANPVTSDLSQPEAFDYSGLDAQTVQDLHLAEREYISGKHLAGMGLRRMADGVAIAHEALCVTDATICRNGETGKFSKADQTFGAWCESVGLNRKAAERLLQVSTLFDRSSPKEQKVLADLAPSLLYAAAKPSARPDLVQGVKDGDITSLKQYREMQARATSAESRAQTAEAQRDAALADVDGLSQQNTRLQEERDSAEKRASETEKQLEGSRQVAAAEHSRAEHWKEKAEAMTRQASAAPIEAKVVDTDEVERLAAEKAEALAAQQMAQRDAKDARDAYDAVILATRSMDAAWQALAPMLPRLAPEEKSQAIHQFVQKLMCIKEDVLKCL